MRIRAASLLIVFASVAGPAYAQKSAPPPPKPQELAAQIANLQARIDKLEGNITAADLVGTYALRSLAVNLTGGSPGDIRSDVIVGTVTVAADGTGSSSVDASGYHLTNGLPSVLGTTSGNGGGNFTWTYANGVVTLSDGNSFTVAAGGRLLVTAVAFQLNPSSGVSTIVILSRLQ